MNKDEIKQGAKLIDFEKPNYKVSEYVESNSSYVQHLAWLLWARTEKTATEKEFLLAKQDLLNQNHVLFLKYINELSGYQVNMIRAISDADRDYYYKDRKFDVTDY